MEQLLPYLVIVAVDLKKSRFQNHIHLTTYIIFHGVECQGKILKKKNQSFKERTYKFPYRHQMLITIKLLVRTSFKDKGTVAGRNTLLGRIRS